MPRGRGRGGSRGGGGRWGDNGFEEWGGYMAAKMAKLEEQFEEDAKKKDDSKEGIFNGVAIFVNGYTGRLITVAFIYIEFLQFFNQSLLDPSSDELKRIMMTHGGTFHHYFNARKTTHYIATNLPDTKASQSVTCFCW